MAKVISKYTDQIETSNKMGEESFITGKTNVTVRFDKFSMSFSEYNLDEMSNDQLIDYAITLAYKEFNT